MEKVVMGVYQNNSGEVVFVERRSDGSYEVWIEGSEPVVYGDDVATHIYNDFDLHGRDIDLGFEDNIDPNPEPDADPVRPHQPDEPDEPTEPDEPNEPDELDWPDPRDADP
jgi:hypothetical protein